MLNEDLPHARWCRPARPSCARLPVLDVACNRCTCHGRLSTSRLRAEHGPDLPMPALRRIIAADCPRMIAGHIHDVCGVHFPGLIGLDLA